eukprot:TRINITY_DN2843_c2_g2_i1.p1 TRINITY_DN2843_c2_g2~~TRINITY_DN2843_c2_g2_i1.p1  ORF type:complete len:430 (+),score=115.78 TRINITY_DN2843_c2_g2_i1:35-1291(+)
MTSYSLLLNILINLDYFITMNFVPYFGIMYFYAALSKFNDALNKPTTSDEGLNILIEENVDDLDNQHYSELLSLKDVCKYDHHSLNSLVVQRAIELNTFPSLNFVHKLTIPRKQGTTLSSSSHPAVTKNLMNNAISLNNSHSGRKYSSKKYPTRHSSPIPTNYSRINATPFISPRVSSPPSSKPLIQSALKPNTPITRVSFVPYNQQQEDSPSNFRSYSKNVQTPISFNVSSPPQERSNNNNKNSTEESTYLLHEDSKYPKCYGFETFIRFLLAETNKSSTQAIKLWFKCADVNGDGFITTEDIHFYYKHQCKMIEKHYMNKIPFTNILQYLFDLIKPSEKRKISLVDLTNTDSFNVTQFFNVLFNFKRFVQNTQNQKRERNESLLIQPLSSWSDWDVMVYDYYRTVNTLLNKEEIIN